MVHNAGRRIVRAPLHRGQPVHTIRVAIRDPLPVVRIPRWHLEDPAIQLFSVTPSTLERMAQPMARNRKRFRRGEGAPQETGAEFYVTVAHEPHAACDSCSQPRPVLIETEDGEWFCEICTGDVDGDELWRAAVITLIGDDGL